MDGDTLIDALHERLVASLKAEILGRADLEDQALLAAVSACLEELVRRGIEPWALVGLLRHIANNIALNAVPPAGSA